jgi:hypothetical protein
LTDYRSFIDMKVLNYRALTAQEAFMRAIVVAATLLAIVLLCSDGAQAAPWCARYNTGLNACNFYSFQQCAASIFGVGGVCELNQFENPQWRGRVARRAYQRAY